MCVCARVRACVHACVRARMHVCTLAWPALHNQNCDRKSTHAWDPAPVLGCPCASTPPNSSSAQKARAGLLAALGPHPTTNILLAQARVLNLGIEDSRSPNSRTPSGRTRLIRPLSQLKP